MLIRITGKPKNKAGASALADELEYLKERIGILEAENDEMRQLLNIADQKPLEPEPKRRGRRRG